VSICADQDRKGQTYLGLLTECFLELAAGQQVEELLGSPQLNVSLERDGVVALHQRVHKLVQPDWVTVLITVGEVIASQELLHGEVSGHADDVLESEMSQPVGVVTYLGFLRVKDAKGLLCISAGILCQLLGCTLRPGSVLIGWVTDQAGEIADKEDDMMAQLLELTELAHGDGVPQVYVRSGGVIAAIDA